MPELTRDRIANETKLAVVKVGTNVLADADGAVDAGRIRGIADQVAALRERGIAVIIVSSGAIGAGVRELALASRPDTLPELQAVAAVGQSKLMRTYSEAFAPHGLHVAQVLVSRDDFADRTRYLNVRQALTALVGYGAVPIVNENDSTSTDEISFGDNDCLSALVTNLVQAPLLVILTTVAGLERRIAGRAEVVDVVRRIDDDILALVTEDRSALGTGGMATKLEAARITTDAGEACVIADGREDNALLDIFEGRQRGTLFVPNPRRMSGRKRWLAAANVPAGSITVDDGARQALVRAGKSLLASGVVAVSGDFRKGDLVTVVDAAGAEIARGLVNYAADQVAAIQGLQTSQIRDALGEKPYDEVIHRDNLALTATSERPRPHGCGPPP